MATCKVYAMLARVQNSIDNEYNATHRQVCARLRPRAPGSTGDHPPSIAGVIPHHLCHRLSPLPADRLQSRCSQRQSSWQPPSFMRCLSLLWLWLQQLVDINCFVAVVVTSAFLALRCWSSPLRDLAHKLSPCDFGHEPVQDVGRVLGECKRACLLVLLTVNCNGIAALR